MEMETGERWNYSSKDTFNLLLQLKGVSIEMEEEKLKLVWNSVTPPKVQVQAWRVI